MTARDEVVDEGEAKRKARRRRRRGPSTVIVADSSGLSGGNRLGCQMVKAPTGGPSATRSQR